MNEVLKSFSMLLLVGMTHVCRSLEIVPHIPQESAISKEHLEKHEEPHPEHQAKQKELQAEIAVTAYEELLQKAADQGDKKALDSLAALYASGVKGKEKYNKAKQYYKHHADAGDSNAHYYLALIYEAEGDDSRAQAYYKRAADKGHMRARYQLALIYEDLALLYEADEDLELARYYYKLAADQGDADAQLNLGRLLMGVLYGLAWRYMDSPVEWGKDAEVALGEALYYLTLAAQQGSEEALDFDIISIANQMGKQEIEASVRDRAYKGDVIASYQIARFYEFEGEITWARYYYKAAHSKGFEPAWRKLRELRRYRDEL